MTEIGKRIKEIRLKKGLSQEELADASKVNLRTIQRIENNETKPREKTLQLIFNALEIEIIEREKKSIDKYLIWSSFLTLIIVIGSFISWFQIASTSIEKTVISSSIKKTGFKLMTATGWNGNMSYNKFTIYNWVVSLCALTIGSIVISNSLKLIDNKIKYILIQLIVISIYLLTLYEVSNVLNIWFRPGLFIVIISTILLSITYLKKKKTSANTL